MESTRNISFWEKNHPLSSLFEQLHEQLVPESGKAPTEQGEALRIVSNLCYEYANNGNMNAIEENWSQQEYEFEVEDEETGEIDWDVEYEDVLDDISIEEDYEEEINYLEETVPNISKEIYHLRDFMLDESKWNNYQYDQKEFDIYNNLIVRVLNWIEPSSVNISTPIEIAEEKSEVKYSRCLVKLTGTDGNAFSVIGTVTNALREHLRVINTPSETIASEIKALREEMMSGDYNNVLATAMRWVNVR